MGYVAKKKINIYYRKSDGTYYYDKMIKGNRFCGFGYKTSKEAEEALRIDLQLIHHNKKVNISYIELTTYYEQYLKDKVKDSTSYDKMQYVHKYLDPFFKKYSLKKISIIDLELWKKNLLQQTKDLTRKHVNKIINVCKDLFLFAHQRFNYDVGFHSLTSVKDDDIIKKENIWTMQDFNMFISVIDNYKYLVLFHFMFYYGVRLGEAIGLKFKNIDFQNGSVSIVSQVVNDRRKHKAIDTTPKTKDSIRTFYIDEFTLNLIQNLYKKRQVYVFGKEDKPIARTTIRRYFNEYIEKSNVVKIRIHALRKSCSTRLYNTIKDVKSVGQLLGHSEESMTMHYIQSQREDQLKMIREMENSIQKNNKIYINLHSEK